MDDESDFNCEMMDIVFCTDLTIAHEWALNIRNQSIVALLE